jgi:peptide/nickel transport system permease protein
MTEAALPAPRPAFVPRLGFALGIVVTASVVGLAVLSRFWTPDTPSRIHIGSRLKAPLVSGLAGTDAMGRDLFSMIMAGAWNSLAIAMASVAFGLCLGVALGSLAAARRGLIEDVIMRIADVVFAFPALISAIMIAALMGPGASTAVLAIGLFNVPVFIRVARGAALRVWARDFCLAAQASGKGRFRITTDHVLPNIAGTLAVQATIQVGLAILVEAGLSFLGLSLAPPAPSWGRMLSDAQTYLAQAPWMAVAPGVAIAITVFGLNLLGDGLRDIFDPRSHARE